MTATVKTVKNANYTPEQVTILRDGFAQGFSNEKLAEMLGKSVRSVIAKLVKENVGYKAKVYVSKTGEKVAKKDETADAIGAVLLMTESEIESLTKANKTALAKIFKALANSKPLESGE
jgi:hypothetical protein